MFHACGSELGWGGGKATRVWMPLSRKNKNEEAVQKLHFCGADFWGAFVEVGHNVPGHLCRQGVLVCPRPLPVEFRPDTNDIGEALELLRCRGARGVT